MKNRLLASVSALALMTGVAACDSSKEENNTVVVDEKKDVKPAAMTDEERLNMAANDLNAAEEAANNAAEAVENVKE